MSNRLGKGIGAGERLDDSRFRAGARQLARGGLGKPMYPPWKCLYVREQYVMMSTHRWMACVETAKRSLVDLVWDTEPTWGRAEGVCLEA